MKFSNRKPLYSKIPLIGKFLIEEDLKPKISFDKEDFYSLDKTIASVLYPLMEKYKDHPKQGFGDIDQKDIPKRIRDTKSIENLSHILIYSPDQKERKGASDSIDKIREKQSDWIWEEIIFSFGEISEGYPKEWEFFDLKENNIKFVPCKDNPKLSNIEYKDGIGPIIDEKGLKKYKDRIQNGLNLFSKYFLQMWT